MTLLLTADLHLTSKPRDEDRWRLLPWIEKQIPKEGINKLYILGDVTDAKDKHPAPLVNRLTEQLYKLAEKIEIVILRGNHDYVSEDTPFFKFLNNHERIKFIIKPTAVNDELFLPNTKDQDAWKDIDFNEYKTIYMHTTFKGAVSENGTRLDGTDPKIFKGFKGHVWSGDIHVPQKINEHVQHVGAPYPIKFGDAFKPRCVHVLDATTSENLYFPFQQKRLVELSVGEALPDLPEGSQIKLRVHLRRRDLVDWRSLRTALVAQALAAKLDLAGIEACLTPERPVRASQEVLRAQSAVDIVKDYTQRKKLDAAFLKTGLSFLA